MFLPTNQIFFSFIIGNINRLYKKFPRHHSLHNIFHLIEKKNTKISTAACTHRTHLSLSPVQRPSPENNTTTHAATHLHPLSSLATDQHNANHPNPLSPPEPPNQQPLFPLSRETTISLSREPSPAATPSIAANLNSP